MIHWPIHTETTFHNPIPAIDLFHSHFISLVIQAPLAYMDTVWTGCCSLHWSISLTPATGIPQAGWDCNTPYGEAAQTDQAGAGASAEPRRRGCEEGCGGVRWDSGMVCVQSSYWVWVAGLSLKILLHWWPWPVWLDNLLYRILCFLTLLASHSNRCPYFVPMSYCSTPNCPHSSSFYIDPIPSWFPLSSIPPSFRTAHLLHPTAMFQFWWPKRRSTGTRMTTSRSKRSSERVWNSAVNMTHGNWMLPTFFSCR